jgi:hypothetical protein
MVIFQDDRRFELTVEARDDTWCATFLGFVPGRFVATLYLHGIFATRQDAIDALVRKWGLLFPEASPLVWHDPPIPPLSSRPSRPRPREGPGYDPR